MKAWGPISQLPFKDQKSRQGRKLASFINQYLYPFSPYYRNLFDTHKINPRSIRSLADLQHLPLTGKSDFLNQEEPDRFKRFVLNPEESMIRQYWPLRKKAALAVRRLLVGEPSKPLGNSIR